MLKLFIINNVRSKVETPNTENNAYRYQPAYSIPSKYVIIQNLI